ICITAAVSVGSHYRGSPRKRKRFSPEKTPKEQDMISASDTHNLPTSNAQKMCITWLLHREEQTSFVLTTIY
ncbi:hypothetical protein, partial [Plesiomonas shigelloides]|uniref:hypothetical protein n=1 Tax=Plesiomonas shigelloides TaxID=703 RepID=UPI001C49A65B